MSVGLQDVQDLLLAHDLTNVEILLQAKSFLDV